MVAGPAGKRCRRCRGGQPARFGPARLGLHDQHRTAGLDAGRSTSAAAVLNALGGRDPHRRRPVQCRAMSVQWWPVHGLSACAACPGGVDRRRGQDKPDALPTPGSGQVDGRSGSGRVVVSSTAHWTRRTWKGSRGTNRHMFTSAARCRRSATYRMKHNSPSASLWSAFPGSTGKTKRSSSTAEQRSETGGRQPL